MVNDMRKRRIVIIGGGTGLPVILRVLRKHYLDITAVITVGDDGGSSGKIRKQIDVIPPGDIRNALSALSESESSIARVFQYRFQNEGELKGHVVGNLLLAALADMHGDALEAIADLSNILNVKGVVLPATTIPLQLQAKMTDGSVVVGESNIPKVRKPIEQLEIVPDDARASQRVVDAIKEADLIAFGPGSLYTSILPNLLVHDIAQAVISSKAQKVYVCNILTQLGETEGFSDADHVRVLHEHVGEKFIDHVLVNEKTVAPALIFPEGVTQVDSNIKGMEDQEVAPIFDDYLDTSDGFVRHDAERVVERLIALIDKSRHS